jgi:hypothetical protein
MYTLRVEIKVLQGSFLILPDKEYKKIRTFLSTLSNGSVEKTTPSGMPSRLAWLIFTAACAALPADLP